MKRFKNISGFLLLFIVFTLLLGGCNNIDPNKNSTPSEVTEDTQQNESNDQSKEVPDLPKQIRLDELANRSYELHYIFALESFENVSEISPSKLVQYAFCHLYYEDLVDMPSGGIMLRETTQDEIKNVLKKHFNTDNIDITKSELYNKSKDVFEMWQPNYGQSIYYDVSATAIDTTTYVINTVFYTDADKTVVKGRTALTVQISEDNVYILKMSSN